MGGTKGLFKVFNYEIHTAFLCSLIYSFFSLILFIIVCIIGWRRVREKELEEERKKPLKKETDEEDKTKGKCHCHCGRIFAWMKLVWTMKTIYLSALVHIYDIGTDVGIIVDWGLQMNREVHGGPEDDVRGLDMRGLFGGAILAFFLY
eukprot:529675_1